jgi:arsenate reductase
MGAGFMRSLGGNKVRVFSGGSEPASKVNPSAVEAMREVGIDIADYVPQKWSMEMLHEVDVVVTMGCGDTCPYIPGKRYVDWPLDDPAGQGVDAVRPIRDQIKSLVETLLSELAVR